jgi:hypothetical protein
MPLVSVGVTVVMPDQGLGLGAKKEIQFLSLDNCL